MLIDSAYAAVFLFRLLVPPNGAYSIDDLRLMRLLAAFTQRRELLYPRALGRGA